MHLFIANNQVAVAAMHWWVVVDLKMYTMHVHKLHGVHVQGACTGFIYWHTAKVQYNHAYCTDTHTCSTIISCLES